MSTQRNQQIKKVAAGSHGRYKWYWVVACICLGLVLVSAVLFLIIQTGLKNAEAGMRDYLHDKYGGAFVVDNYKIEGAALGEEGDPTADAYPRANPSLKFQVWDRGKYTQGNHAYSDNYINAVWSSEETKALSSNLQQIFGYLPEYKVTVGFSGVLKDYRNIPSFGEALQRQSENISFYLSLTSSEPINSTSIELHSMRVLKLIKLLKKTNAKKLQLIYDAKNGGIYLKDKQLRDIDSIEQVKSNVKMKEQR